MADSPAPATPATPAPTRSIREILGLHDLFVFLGDGHVELLRDANGQILFDKAGNPQRGKVTPFTLGIKARYAVLKNRGLTEKVVKRVQKLRDDQITELAGGANTLSEENDPGAVKRKQLAEEIEKLLTSEETIALHQIPIDDLRLDINPLITDSIVLALGDLVSAPKE